MVESMRTNGFNVQKAGHPDSQLIDVVDVGDGTFSSLDNRRIVAAEEAGVDVIVRVHKPDDKLDPMRFAPEDRERFLKDPFTGKIAETWGEAAQVRVKRQYKQNRLGKEWYERNKPWGAVIERPLLK